MPDNKNTNIVLPLVLVGVVAGAAAYVYLNSPKGEKTKELLRKKVKKAVKDLKLKLKDVDIEKIVDTAADKIKDISNELKSVGN